MKSNSDHEDKNDALSRRTHLQREVTQKSAIEPTFENEFWNRKEDESEVRACRADSHPGHVFLPGRSPPTTAIASSPLLFGLRIALNSRRGDSEIGWDCWKRTTRRSLGVRRLWRAKATESVAQIACRRG